MNGEHQADDQADDFDDDIVDEDEEQESPLPRRVPAQNSRRVPRAARPTEQTVRHLLDILKHLPE